MTMLYASLAELKQRLNISETGRDSLWRDVIESASRWVDDITGRRFHASSDIDSENPTEIRYYQLDPYTNPLELEIDDVLTVTEIVTDANGDGTFEYTWVANTDYWLGPRNAAAKNRPYTHIHKSTYAGRYWFPSYPNSIKVTGNFGYCTLATLPANIRQLTMMVAEASARPMLELGVAGVGTYKLGPDLTVTMAADNLPLMARKSSAWTVLLDARTAEVIGFLPLDSF